MKATHLFATAGTFLLVAILLTLDLFDGRRVAAGSPSAGAAVLATAVPPNLDLQSLLITNNNYATLSRIGFSVSVSGDTIVIGAPGENNANGNQAGAIYVYVRSGVGADTMWTRQARILPADGVEGDQFGYSVSIDGDTLVAGAQTDDDTAGTDQGAAYVYIRSAGVWTQQAKLFPSDAGAGDLFGTEVSVSGNTAVIGAPFYDVAGDQNQGAVYVFTRSAGVWSQQTKILSPDSPFSSWFGITADIDGDNLIVGSPLDYVSGEAGRGSALVYTRSGSVWTFQAKLVASNGGEGDRFGTSVSIEGGTAAVGAPFFEDGSAIDTGAAYVFTRSGIFWNQQAALYSDQPNNTDQFGRDVQLSGSALLVGAPGDGTPFTIGQGSVFLFVKSGSIWSQRANVFATDGESGDKFGWSVSIDGELVAAGAPYGLNGYNFGSAYALYPSCTFTVDPVSVQTGTSGGTGSFALSTPAGCPWTASSDSQWLTLTSPAAGSGPATMEYSVAPNTGIARTGSITTGDAVFTVSQSTFCSFSLSSGGLDTGAAAGSSSFDVIVDNQACTWTAVPDSDWITVTSGGSGTGNGTVSFDFTENAGGPRAATITAAGIEFTVTQATDCAYTLSPSSTEAPPSGGAAAFSIVTTSECPWTASSNSDWITVTGGSSGTGSGSVAFSVAPSSGASRTGTITAAGKTFSVFQTGTNGQNGITRFDFDGDGRTDPSVFRPSPAPSTEPIDAEGSSSEWWILRSTSGNLVVTFGAPTDKLVPADFTGDGKSDIAFWRPSTGEWYILRSDDLTFFAFPFGANGDLPAPGDFDGDGKADPAVFRPSNATWFILRSSDSQVASVPFGVNGDKPAVADYDGDGTDDIAVFRPSVSQWWQLRSTEGVKAYGFGGTGDRTAVADWTGDGKADIGFFRPATTEFYVIRSEDDSFYAFPWGTSGDLPVPGDYDGDGTSDAAVWRPADTTWYILGSTSGFVAIPFGAAGDVPVPSSVSVQ